MVFEKLKIGMPGLMPKKKEQTVVFSSEREQYTVNGMLPALKWLQIPSHGFAGSVCLYTRAIRRPSQ
jgi:hypothetical protein